MNTRLRSLFAGIVVVLLLAAGAASCGGSKKVEVSTFVGDPTAGGSLDGTGSAARFNLISGMTCDTAGNLYVTDDVTIRKITPAGNVFTVAGKANHSGTANGTGAAALFKTPMGIAADPASNLYVADRNSNTIRRITPTGKVSTLAGKAGWFGTIGYPGSADGTGSAARFKSPEGVACDAAGNVYVTDWGNGTIRKITPDGLVTTLAGKAGTHGHADGSGAAARFEGPSDIACDTAGNLYVIDGWTIRKVTPAGVVTTLAGQADTHGSVNGTGSAASFGLMSGIVCDSAGNLYVTDNDTVRKITPTGVVSTLAGKAGVPGYVDGSGASARFDTPLGIARDAAGTIYVADGNTPVIRKITLTH
jgi:sugar lactone lactonase YvrE